MRIRTLLLFAALLFPAHAAGALEQLRLESAALGEQRDIYVRLPPDYDRSASPFPTLYVTDAESAFNHLCAEVEFLERNRRIPQLIVVGITNTKRVRDLTPTVDEARPGSGGAERFLDFIERELIPSIGARYRAAPWRAFAGHSLGGLFSLWTLATRPTLFDAYIAISPSLHYDDSVVLGRLEKALSSPWKRPSRLWVTTGSEGPENAALFARLEKLLRKKAPRQLDWESRTFPDEDHGSVVLPSHYYGLRAIFRDWPVSLRTANGPVDDPIRYLDAHFARLTKSYGWEIRTPEVYLNELGYRQLAEGNSVRAIEILAENARRYPDSPNAWDSLGEAYETDGQIEKARANYEKAADLAAAKNDPLAATYKARHERLTPK
jgi:predicted alpha/beta superfamily hydrolase